MSRETDSSSSGPQGRGGPAYAPGTEPYGAAGHGEPTDGAASGPGHETGVPAEEPRTETQLTTRIRINIPGSRPIPPVVMRKPVGEGGGSAADRTGEPPVGAAQGGAPGTAAAPGGAEMAAGGPGGPGAPGGSDGRGGSHGPGRAGGGSGESRRSTSDWFAPRKAPRQGAQPGAGPGAGQAPPGGGPGGDGGPGMPYPFGTGRDEEAQDHPHTPPDGFPSVPPQDAVPGPGRSAIAGLDGPPGGPGVPGGPTTGPVGGDTPLGQPQGAPGMPGAPGTPGDPGRPGDDPLAGSTLGLGTGPSVFPESGPPSSLYTQGTPGGPPDGTPPGPDRIAGDTLVSGIPRVPSVDGGGFPGPATPTPPPAGGEIRDRGDADEGPPASKGRSKLVLVGFGLVGVLGVAYGAGLLLDHADVPNGTTVLGVDIGGKDQQSAVNSLDAALADRMTAPLTVVANGEETPLKPSVAGLTIDTEATVREASGRDYNPVSVIGSLLGGSREAEAAVEVDEEKLESALASVATQGGGTPQDGMVTFEGGKAKAVPGRTHKGIDVAQASRKIEEAYRGRAASGENEPVTLPVSTQQPAIGEQELQAAVDGFGKTAMSGWVWLRAGDVEVPFSEKTIGTFLTMQPGGDKLVPVIDTARLKATYGSAFDNVVIAGGNGTVAMTPKHAAAAMVQALKEPAPAEPAKRVAEVEGASSR